MTISDIVPTKRDELIVHRRSFYREALELIHPIASISGSSGNPTPILFIDQLWTERIHPMEVLSRELERAPESFST